MFRHGPKAALVVHEEGGNRFLLTLGKPTLESLQLGLVSLGLAPKAFSFVVVRDNAEFAVRTDRDVEELGFSSTAKREVLKLVSVDVSALPGLEEFCPPRSTVPVTLAPESCCVIAARDVACKGKEMLASLSRNGYFRLKFDAELMECVNNAFDATEAFFAASQEEKNAFQGTTTGRLAPFFGYRHVPSMKKEFFVFRNTELLPVPNLLAPLRPTFFRFGELLLECMKAMIPCELGDCFGSVKTMAELKHSTFLEVFKYDGIPLNGALGEQKVRITSQEHRDTSLLTLIPQARGAAGLEAYDWSAYQWRSLEGPGHESEAVVFAGELFCAMFRGSNMPALNHRVCVAVGGKPRISMPFELLPEPSEENRRILSSLGQGLVSVNY